MSPRGLHCSRGGVQGAHTAKRPAARLGLEGTRTDRYGNLRGSYHDTCQEMRIPPSIDRATSRLASLIRLRNGGAIAVRSGPAPTPSLVLYEYEASPYCRRVREALCVLGLSVEVRPCPRETLRREGAFGGGARHKPEVIEQGGRLLFPFLHDRTADVSRDPILIFYARTALSLSDACAHALSGRLSLTHR